MFRNENELSVIQKTYDFIKWYVPVLARLPKDYKFTLGDRIVSRLYDLLEGLIATRYAKKKAERLEQLKSYLDIIRYQTRLLLDFELIDKRRYEYISQQTNGIGNELGGWLKHQQARETAIA